MLQKCTESPGVGKNCESSALMQASCTPTTYHKARTIILNIITISVKYPNKSKWPSINNWQFVLNYEY